MDIKYEFWTEKYDHYVEESNVGHPQNWIDIYNPVCTIVCLPVSDYSIQNYEVYGGLWDTGIHPTGLGKIDYLLWNGLQVICASILKKKHL